MNIDIESLRYPVGKFSAPSVISQEDLADYIHTLETLPSKVADIWKKLPVEKRNIPYREGGWNAKQLIHHLADSHINAFIRIKLALTEDHPTIKPYKEALWAELPDYTKTDPTVSIQLLTAVHERMLVLLNNISEADFDRTYFHPESNKEFTIKTVVALYAWHSSHHLAHLEIIFRS